jgi:hypothetical protein
MIRAWLMCLSIAVAKPAWRPIQTATDKDGIVWRIEATPPNSKRCVPGRVRLTVSETGKPPAQLTVDGECEKASDDDPGAWSTWALHEVIRIDGKLFVILINDDAADDHRSLDYYLYGYGCGKIQRIARIASDPGFEANKRGSLAKLADAKGPPGARWKLLSLDYDYRWTNCEYVRVEEPE